MNRIKEGINKGVKVFKESSLAMKFVYVLALLGLSSFVLRNPFVAVITGLIGYVVYRVFKKRQTVQVED